MPSGWWNIGRSPARILRPRSDRPFLFAVGDQVRFARISAADFEALAVEENAA
jgi:inhibitor of KinA